MLLPIAFFLGAALGWTRSRARGGDRLDHLQYAAAHGILFVIVTLALTIVARRLDLF